MTSALPAARLIAGSSLVRLIVALGAMSMTMVVPIALACASAAAIALARLPWLLAVRSMVLGTSHLPGNHDSYW